MKNDKSTDTGLDDISNIDRSNSIIAHTAIIDNLRLQRNELIKDIELAEDRIADLEERLTDQNIRISKNLFYVFLIFLGFVIYLLNSQLVKINASITESNILMRDIKTHMEK